MPIRRLAKFACLGCCLVLFAACGGGSSTGAADSGPTPTSTPTPPSTGGGTGTTSPGPLGVVEDRSAGLMGTDADANGIRDDVDALIQLKYASSTEIKKAAERRARAIQALLVSSTQQEALRAADALMSAAYCQFKLPVAMQVKRQMTKDLEALTANTKERLLAYVSADKLLNGSAQNSPTNVICE